MHHPLRNTDEEFGIWEREIEHLSIFSLMCLDDHLNYDVAPGSEKEGMVQMRKTEGRLNRHC